MKTRAQLKQAAKHSLKGRWGEAILMSIVFGIILTVISNCAGPQVVATQYNTTSGMTEYQTFMSPINYLFWGIQMIVTGPLTYGLTKFFLQLAHHKKADLTLLGEGFNHFSNTFLLYILMMVKVFLWTLLLIIPGIIAAYRYSQAFFILAENPNIKPNDALKRSSELMEGHKCEFFILQLSFLGWAILAVFTCFIGYIWLVPYMQTTFAHYYLSIKPNPVQKAVKTVKKKVAALKKG